MNLLHLCHGYYPALGGTEHLIREVSERLVHDFGDDVTVLTPNTRSIEAFTGRRSERLPVGVEWINGVRVRRFPVTTWPARPLYLLQGASFVLRLPGNDWLRTFYNGPISRPFWQAARSQQADLIAASSFPLLHMQYAVWGGKHQRRPVVLHGGLHPEDRWGFDRQSIYRTIAACDHYIANTTYERDVVVRHGVDAGKVSVIGPGTDPVQFSTADGTAVRERYTMSDRPVIGFVGQQASHKGLDTLIEAMPRIWREQPDVRLLIAGARTRFSSRIDSMLHALKDHQQRVHVVPDFKDEDKANLFAACDIIAYPSGYESFGMTFLEAWASRKPVVGCRSGAVPSVVRDEQDGLLVPFHNASALASALLRLLSDPALRRRLGESGYQKVLDDYTWTKVTSAWRTVYEDVLATYRPGGGGSA